MNKLFVLSAIAAASIQSAHAVDIKAGDWTVGVGGIVNAYYTAVSCSGAAIGGLALGSEGIGCGGQGDRTTIGNGLLPNGLVMSGGTSTRFWARRPIKVGAMREIRSVKGRVVVAMPP